MGRAANRVGVVANLATTRLPMANTFDTRGARREYRGAISCKGKKRPQSFAMVVSARGDD